MTTYAKDALPGGKDYYKVNPEAKRYTLRDNGFTESKNGSFHYERILSMHSGDKTAPRLKIIISRAIDELKLSTVTANGLKKIDLYKSEQLTEEKQFAENIIQTLVEGNVLIQA
ncbi:hypothetical protein ADIAL_1663 [Alkalibacterium sp. AK22]|uniref:hypothetical protein n=1 Tax=Alkalibacterium sp. AK22 TaxID=1229520 RepID=UPI00044F87AE|nr:hypothetical protein [Alkalibacterium sp. AK22]EXJ22812.1 hypothetical protein ADIAL_1663 [Alkalibacterium sp. AK22]